MLMHSAQTLQPLHRLERSGILCIDSAPSPVECEDALWSTVGMSTAILRYVSVGVYQKLGPYFAPLHQATKPRGFEMFCHALQNRGRADIRDRVGMLHNVANHRSKRLDEHRRTEHQMVPKYPPFSPLYDIYKQHGDEWHHAEVFQGVHSLILKPVTG